MEELNLVVKDIVVLTEDELRMVSGGVGAQGARPGQEADSLLQLRHQGLNPEGKVTSSACIV